MAASLTLARAGFRKHRRGLLGISVMLALGLGVALASLEAARRTENAYPAYLRRAEVGELAVNPSLITDRAAAIIASTPGVAGMVSDAWLTATPDDGHPRTQNQIDSDSTDMRVSADGRYIERDRPAIHEGRMVSGGAEAFVSVETAEALELEVGDVLPLAFWSADAPPVERTSDVVDPVGRTEVEVVGVGVFADEVLADGLYPRQRVLVSPDVGSRFDCTPPHPDAADTRSLEQLAAAFFPPGCARSYRQFSLQVDGGEDGVAALVSALNARFADENTRLPAALRGGDLGFSVIPSVTADLRQRVQRSLAPAVRALQLYALAAGTATLVVALLGALRIARRHEEDARIWGSLGTVRTQQMAAIALPLALSATAGLAGSLVVAWLGSGVGPVASARAVEPAGRLGLTPVVALAVLGLSATVLTVGHLLAASVASKSTTTPVARRTARRGRSLPGIASPSLVLGARAAVGSSGSGALLGAAVAAVSALLATAVFTTSLDTLVSDGERFGWPYDAAVMIGYGYGGADQAAIATTLERPEVRSWGLAALPLGVTVNGETLPVVAEQVGFDDLPVPVVEGRMPTGDDEIGLGALTAERLGVGVGDQVAVSTPTGERAATVEGLVVLPPVGPFESDRASLGTGVLLPARFLAATRPDVDATSPEDGAGAGSGNPFDIEADGSFVGIDLGDGVDSQQFLSSISGELPTWDQNRFIVLDYPDPVRPSQIADVAAMRAIPGVLVGVFVLAMAGGLVLGIAVATRARRRELALLRAVGATGRQLRASVRAQSLAVVGVGLGIGIPVGLALGRASYRRFATGLGALPDPVVSLPWTVVIVVSTLAIGALAAAGPGRRAARTRPAAVLRHE